VVDGTKIADRPAGDCHCVDHESELFTVNNLLNILQQTSVNAIMAVGMTLVILTSGIDLSVGSLLALTGAVAASLVGMEVNALVAVAAALALGDWRGNRDYRGERASTGVYRNPGHDAVTARCDAGLHQRESNQYRLYGQCRSLWLVRYWSSAGDPDAGMDHGDCLYRHLVHTASHPPGPLYLCAWGNEAATRLSGISVDKVKVIVYSLCGLLASLAGIIEVARLSSGQPTAGTGYELDAIAAVVLGGTSLAGGKGRIVGTLIGALILGFLNNGLNLLSVSSYYQMIVKAVVILLAVLVDNKKQ
jgi:ribose transport system permease protein